MPLKTRFEDPDLTGYRWLFSAVSPLTDAQGIDTLKRQLTGSDVSMEPIISMANTYLMVTALWAGLRGKKLDVHIGIEINDYLQELHTLNVKRNQGLKHQALEAIEALNKAGIDPMLIKGAVQLFQPLHADSGTRIMTDLDIVVPEDRMDRAVETLMEIGYHHVHEDSELDWDTHHHIAPLGRSGDYGAIDLHRNALDPKGCKVLPTAELWSTGRILRGYGLQFKVPDLTRSVLITFLHSQVSHDYHRKLIIDYKSMYDMVIAATHKDHALDWGAIRSRLAAHGMESILNAYLWTAHRLFHLPMPTGIRPTHSAKAYHLACLATIRWDFVDKWFDRIFVSFRKQIQKKWSYLKRRFSH